MTKIALLILYNHRYDKNIERLEALYEGKFSYIFHIMPFYDGTKENVIPVYESSYYFQSYIAQAYHHIKKLDFTHYFVVADDMILHPTINENNLLEVTGIGYNNCFISDIREIYDYLILRPAFKQYTIKQKGVEVDQILPSRKEALQLFENHHLRTNDMECDYLRKCLKLMIKQKRLRATIGILQELIHKKKRQITYPLVWGYSDILLITKDVMPTFVTYCGAFAATKLFVEYAIPTALIFSTESIVTDEQLSMHGIPQIYPRKKIQESSDIVMTKKKNTTIEKEVFDEKYHNSLQTLLTDFPKNTFFIHPIKLSQWK